MFVEHGAGRYKTYNNGSAGSGDATYTGGGLLGKWTGGNGFYVEGSFRAGRVKDTASDVLRNPLGNAYGYNTKTSYYGATGQKCNWYVGLAYEHEFNGEAQGTADGVRIRSADISGGSVRMEVGAKLVPSENSPWLIDLNLTGYVGERRSIMGGVKATFMF